jgi:hypothetical protein
MKSLLTLLLAISASVCLAQTDEELVKKTVLSAYVEGIHNGGTVDQIRQGFHPAFQMLRLAENEVRTTSIDEWIKGIEKARTENKPAGPRSEAHFLEVTVSGSSANVVLELSREGKKIFTDHLLLYKFNEGWRIVAKTFFRHP